MKDVASPGQISRLDWMKAQVGKDFIYNGKVIGVVQRVYGENHLHIRTSAGKRLSVHGAQAVERGEGVIGYLPGLEESFVEQKWKPE